MNAPCGCAIPKWIFDTRRGLEEGPGYRCDACRGTADLLSVVRYEAIRAVRNEYTAGRAVKS